VCGDHLAHERLGVGRIVGLVVPVPPVADQVDDHVLAELLPERDRELRRVHAGLGIVGVHVEDRRLDQLGAVARVLRESVVARIGREADLVVHDDVDRAAGPVALELRERERLEHDALAGERRVAVDLQRDDFRALGVAAVVLLGADDPLGDRIDPLEVTRVRAQRQVHALAGARAAIGRVAAVVLHVARALRVRRHERGLERGHDRVVRHVQGVGHDVQAPAMGHREHDLRGAELGRTFGDGVEHRDQ
jgi:hypothetical protein